MSAFACAQLNLFDLLGGVEAAPPASSERPAPRLTLVGSEPAAEPSPVELLAPPPEHFAWCENQVRRIFSAARRASLHKELLGDSPRHQRVIAAVWFVASSKRRPPQLADGRDPSFDWVNRNPQLCAAYDVLHPLFIEDSLVEPAPGG